MASDRTPAFLGNQAMFTLTVEGCDDELRVVRFTGQEAISALFEFQIEIASATLPLDSLVNKPALLTIEGMEATRHVHGFICEAGYAGESPSYTLYELTLVPALWRLHQRTNCRIFQQMATPEILAKVLDGAGLPRAQFRLDLQGRFAPRDYCVQYRESDLDFASRLMEDAGIFYYFEHTASKHVLVMTDRDGVPAIEGDPTLGFVAGDEREVVSHFRVREGVRPQRVTVRDKNLHRPDEPMEASEGANIEREIYDFPGAFQEVGKGAPHKGGQQAKLRLEGLQASRRRALGGSDCARLLPGFAFKLVDGVRSHLEGEYRIIRVIHHGEQPQSLDEGATGGFRYRNEFECTDKMVSYRPLRSTPRPQVRGAQTATVVGPPGEEVHVDEHGRVKVQFHWDRRDLYDDSSSCWVRVSQLWAGNNFGAMFIPRIGHEVIVDFLEGDPDRPIITGRVYTGLNKPPYALPDERTKSTIKSESSPGGGGSNELRFEDAKGSEEVYVHAQKDMNTVIENDQTLRVGHDLTRTVLHDQTEIVANNNFVMVGSMHDETIGANMSVTVGANLTVAVGADVMFTCTGGFVGTVGGSKSETVARSSETTIGEAHTVSVGGAQTVSVGGSASEAVQGARVASVGGDSSEQVAGGKSLSVGENITESAAKNISLSAGKHLNISIGENLNISAGKKAGVVVADKVTVQCGDATVTIQKNGDITVQGKQLNLKASGDVMIKGSNIKLN